MCGALAHPPRYSDLDTSAKVFFLVVMGLTFFAALMLYCGLASAAGVL
jgi:hypothetical protein